MPLTPKDDVSEAGEQPENQPEPSARMSALEDRLSALEESAEPPGEQGETVGEALENVEDYADGAAALAEDVREEVEELRETVERQERVILDLVQVLEYVGGAADGNGFERGVRAVKEEGSDGYPWSWDAEVLEVKSERYE